MPPPVTDSLSVHALPVTDLRRSRAWYADVLRATPASDAGEVLAVLGTRVRLVTAAHGPSAHVVTIPVADCRSTYEALRERGAAFLAEPDERGSDTRCQFRDPDGNPFELREFRG